MFFGFFFGSLVKKKTWFNKRTSRRAPRIFHYPAFSQPVSSVFALPPSLGRGIYRQSTSTPSSAVPTRKEPIPMAVPLTQPTLRCLKHSSGEAGLKPDTPTPFPSRAIFKSNRTFVKRGVWRVLDWFRVNLATPHLAPCACPGWIGDGKGSGSLCGSRFLVCGPRPAASLLLSEGRARGFRWLHCLS
jgi:hypothetical protein